MIYTSSLYPEKPYWLFVTILSALLFTITNLMLIEVHLGDERSRTYCAYLSKGQKRVSLQIKHQPIIPHADSLATKRQTQFKVVGAIIRNLGSPEKVCMFVK